MTSPVNKSKTPINPKLVKLAYEKHGSLKRAWKAEFKGIQWGRVLENYRAAVQLGLMPVIRVGAKTSGQLKDPAKTLAAPTGSDRAMETKVAAVPKKGVKRYLFTSAQNNTDVFMPFWRNLLVLKEHYEAELHIARFVYLTNSTSSSTDKQKAFERLEGVEREKQDITWAPEFDPYLSDYRMEIAPGLVWCGEQNTLPTAENPLSGFESFTGRKSAIFPHVKIAMQSVPSAKHAPTKFNYTTGTVTKRNYIQRKAGLKAEFHHAYAALLVEVTPAGEWFCRQINSNSEGVIQDLDVLVNAEGKLTTGNTVEAITWDDIHTAQMVPWVQELSWGKGGIVDQLKPKHQFFHDVLDFRAKSHHELKHPHRMFRRYLLGESDVRMEVTDVCEFLRYAARPYCANVVVDSNHHDHMGVWLETSDGRFDPKNAEFWSEMQSRVLGSLRSGRENPDYLALSVEAVDPELFKGGLIKFLARDESYIICEDANGGIECGTHGHAGPNGSRGSPQAFSRTGRKYNLGHYHQATIKDGVYVGGTCGKLDPDWTAGPGAWSHTFIVTYPTGKRALVTRWNNKWRA
jgi:hypothetical protein